MTIIEHLEQSASLRLLGEEQNIAHISLLEPFYALLIARLAQPKAYTQLLQAHNELSSTHLAAPSNPVVVESVRSSLAEATNNHSIFDQLWQDQGQRQLIIDELVATHYVEEETTIKLITGAATLAYPELKALANGQFLPAFLQQQQSDIRHYLPVWAESVLIDHSTNNTDKDGSKSNNGFNINNGGANSIDSEHYTASLTGIVAIAESDELRDVDIVKEYNEHNSLKTTHQMGVIALTSPTDTDNDNLRAPHIPIDHNGHSVTQINHTRRRNKRNRKRWLLFLLIVAMTALVLLWLFVIQPKRMTAAEPEVIAPVAVVAKPEPIVPVVMPVSLLVAVDNSGSLYNCSATIGDGTLQESLKQALIMSFGDQASICQFNIKPDVASSLTTLNIGLLPSLFTLLRSAPFARLQLQNNIITVESPDDMVSQRLLMDMRTLAPTATIVTTAPLGATDSVAIDNSTEQRLPNNGLNDPNNIQNMDNRDDNFNYPSTYNNGLEGSNNTFNSNNSNDTIDNVARPNNFDNNVTTDNRSIGGMSSAEVDALASQVIVAEQLRNESRVEKNIASE